MPTGLVTGPDGDLLADANSSPPSRRISAGRRSPRPRRRRRPPCLSPSVDGALWFTDPAADAVGRRTTRATSPPRAADREQRSACGSLPAPTAHCDSPAAANAESGASPATERSTSSQSPRPALAAADRGRDRTARCRSPSATRAGSGVRRRRDPPSSVSPRLAANPSASPPVPPPHLLADGRQRDRRSAPDGTITEYPIATTYRRPLGITAGPRRKRLVPPTSSSGGSGASPVGRAISAAQSVTDRPGLGCHPAQRLRDDLVFWRRMRAARFADQAAFRSPRRPAISLKKPHESAGFRCDPTGNRSGSNVTERRSVTSPPRRERCGATGGDVPM